MQLVSCAVLGRRVARPDEKIEALATVETQVDAPVVRAATVSFTANGVEFSRQTVDVFSASVVQASFIPEDVGFGNGDDVTVSARLV